MATGISNEIPKKVIQQNSEIISETESDMKNNLHEAQETIKTFSSEFDTEQIDIETKIADLEKSKKEKSTDERDFKLNKDTLDHLSSKRQELSELIRNKPEDEQRKNNNIEENHFKKFTNLFYTKKNTQENINKIDPSVYTLDEKQPTDEEEKKMEKKSSPLRISKQTLLKITKHKLSSWI